MRFFFTKLILLIQLIALFTIYSCNTKDDKELVPSYIQIDTIQLRTKIGEGSSSSKITDAWVYIDNELIGVFELPATVPILKEGRQKLKVLPGIKLNGISSTRNPYFFYTRYEKEIELKRNSVIKLPTIYVEYVSNIDFMLLEDFELPGMLFDSAPSSKVNIVKTNDPKFLLNIPNEVNNYAGRLSLNVDSAKIEIISTEKYDFPPSQKDVFLELDYLADYPCLFGVYYDFKGARVQKQVLLLNQTKTWKKVYINLSYIKNQAYSATNIQLFFGAFLINKIENGNIILDNIKLLKFRKDE